MSEEKYIKLITDYSKIKNITLKEAATILINAIKSFNDTAESWSAERVRH